MKKVFYVLILPLMVVSGLVFANRESKKEADTLPKPVAFAEMRTDFDARKQWEASPDGIRFRQWQASPAGKKVYAAEAKIQSAVSGHANMEAVVTSLSLPPGSRLGFGIMVRINGDDYILTFDADNTQLEKLQRVKVNDRMIIKSSTISHAPKYAYPIVRCDYAEHDGKVIYKRVPRPDGC